MASVQKKEAKVEKERINASRAPDAKRESSIKTYEKTKTDFENERHALHGKLKSYQYNRMIDLKVKNTVFNIVLTHLSASSPSSCKLRNVLPC